MNRMIHKIAARTPGCHPTGGNKMWNMRILTMIGARMVKANGT
jgi:hypothetical protein